MFTRLLPLTLSLVLAACGGSNGDATPAANANGSTAGAASVPASAFETGLTRYEAAARDYVAAIDANTPAQALTPHLDKLLAISGELLPEFLSRKPHCRSYLEAALALKDTWTTLSADQIETGYHKDEALPRIDNAAACYHFKDLIVHPITAQALLNEGEGNRAGARREIDEVIAHLAVVRATR